MKHMWVRRALLCGIAVASAAASIALEQEAEACSLALESPRYVTSTFPADGAQLVNLETPIAVRWSKQEPAFDALAQFMADGDVTIQRFSVSQGEAFDEPSAHQAKPEELQLGEGVVIWDSVHIGGVLFPDTPYTARVVLSSQSGSEQVVEWSFRTGMGGQIDHDDDVALSELQLVELPVAAFSCCQVPVGECSSCWQSGWNWANGVSLRFDAAGAPHASVADVYAPTDYRYAVYAHPDAAASSSQLVGIYQVNAWGAQQIDIQGESPFVAKPGDPPTERCYSVELIRPDEVQPPAATGMHVLCRQESERIAHGEGPALTVSPLECETERPRNPPRDEGDDMSCQSVPGAPPQGLGSLLLLALGLVGLRRRGRA